MECPICHSANITSDFFQFKIEGTGLRKIHLCKSCDLYFLSPAPRQTDIKDYYKEKLGVTSLTRLRKIFKSLFRTYRSLDQFQYINRKIQREKLESVMEVGAGDGRLISLYRNKLNCLVRGTEYSDVNIEFAQTKYRLDLKKEDLDKVKGKYDLLIMSHVFEHFSDLKNTLDTITGLLADEGTLFIEVPYSPMAASECDRSELENYLSTSHIYNFRPENLRLLLEREQFEVISLNRVIYNFPFPRFVSLRRRAGQVLLEGIHPQAPELLFILFYLAGNVLHLRSPFKVLENENLQWNGPGDNIRIIARRAAE